MARLQLTLACGDYDLTRPLIDGTVRPDGIELIPLVMSSPQRHWKMLRHEAFDVCELSMASFLTDAGLGRRRFVAIPVFPHRRFRHAYVFVNKKAGVEGPKDLEGKKVGLRTFQTTAGLWMRGILQHHYGVRLDRIEWITQDEEDIPFAGNEQIRLKRVAEGETVDDLLLSGRLAAVIYPDELPSFERGDARVARLFPDYKAEEIRYYQETGIFPIMHTVVLKRSLAERHPWAARSLYDAFCEAKRLAYRRLNNPRAVPLAWAKHAAEEQRHVLGPDPYSYGLGQANRRNLDTLAQYAWEQGLTPEKVRIEALFDETILDTVPQYLTELEQPGKGEAGS